MRAKEQKLENAEHSWSIWSNQEDTAGKLVLSLQGRELALGMETAGWELEQSQDGSWRRRTLVVIAAGEPLRDERNGGWMAGREAGWRTKRKI